MVAPLGARAAGAPLDWRPPDFILWAALIGSAALLLEGALARLKGPGARAPRAAAAIAIATAVLALWANGAVGLVGAEGAAHNRLFPAILLGSAIMAVIVRGRPAHLSALMAATAVALAAAALLAGLGSGAIPIPALILALPFALSAWLFGRAARA